MTETAGSQQQGPKKSWAFAAAGWLALAGLVGVVYVLFAGMSKPASDSGFARFATGGMAKLQVREPPPEQTERPFRDAEGAQRTLADFRGKAVLVNFWATWCTACVKEMPTLAALDRDFSGQPFEVLAISMDGPRELQHAREKLAELTGGQLDFYIDTTRTIGLASGAEGLPTTILFDREGRELARLAGEADWASPEAKKLMQAAIEAGRVEASAR